MSDTLTATGASPLALEIVPDPTCFGRCTSCSQPGIPYEYRGLLFGGLTARQGERLCRTCRDERMAAEGVNILVVSWRPEVPPYVANSARDTDVIHVGAAVPEQSFGYSHSPAHEHRADRAPCCCPCTSCTFDRGTITDDLT